MTTEHAAPDTATALQDFIITFGIRYKSRPYPTTVNGIRPDARGWVRARATDGNAAHALAQRYFGCDYAGMYPAWRFDASWYPLGELFTITD
jgi:hypothetical protein